MNTGEILTGLSVSGRKETITTSVGMKGVDAVRLYVDKKEVPILIAALERYLEQYSQDRQIVKKLLNKIEDCDSLQISQHPRSDA